MATTKTRKRRSPKTTVEEAPKMEHPERNVPYASSGEVGAEAPVAEEPEAAREPEAEEVEEAEFTPEATSGTGPQETPQAKPEVALTPVTLKVPVARLREVLELLAPAVPRKATLPVLANVRLGEGKAAATDLEVRVTMAMPEASEPLLAPYRATVDFLKYCPGHLTATLAAEGRTLAITAGGSSLTLAAADPADYPPGPKTLEEARTGVLTGDELVRALTAVLPYAARDESRPVLAGVALATGEQVEAVAADGVRLAWEAIPGRLPGEDTIIMPKGMVKALEHLWRRATDKADLSGVETPAQIATAQRLMLLSWTAAGFSAQFGGRQGIVVETQLIQGTFPKYRQLIPAKLGPAISFLAGDMLRVLKQLDPMARESSGIVRLQWEGSELRLSARGDEVGNMTVSLPVKSTGDGKIAVNLSYLMEYCEGKEGMAELALSGGPTSPVALSYRGRLNQVLMPMFVQW